MMKFKIHLIILWLGMLFISCNQNKSDEIINPGYDFYPLEKGHFVVYDVQNIVHNVVGTIDTFNYQIKEVIGDTNSAKGNAPFGYKLFRYKRPNSTIAWTLDSVWQVWLNSNVLVVNENGEEYIKLSFPLKNAIKWNGNTYNSTGIYVDTLQTIYGCDSVVTIYLTILKPDTVTFKETACDSFVSLSGANTWLKSGFFSEKMSNQVMCDSIIQYDLTINYSNQSFVNYDECNPFNTPAGTSITSSGIYTEVLTNSLGCDSTVTVSATITKNKPIITKIGENLEVDLTDLSYQWLDCDNAYASIPSATSATYKPNKSGNYAVEVIENNCKDTSACLNYPSTANLQNIYLIKASIVPNPAQSTITIHNHLESFYYEILNHFGQVMLEDNGLTGNEISISELANGTYYIKVISASYTDYVKLIVQKP